MQPDYMEIILSALGIVYLLLEYLIKPRLSPQKFAQWESGLSAALKGASMVVHKVEQVSGDASAQQKKRMAIANLQTLLSAPGAPSPSDETVDWAIEYMVKLMNDAQGKPPKTGTQHIEAMSQYKTPLPPREDL